MLFGKLFKFTKNIQAIKAIKIFFIIINIISCIFLTVFADNENLVTLYLLANQNDPIVLEAKQNQLAVAESLSIARANFLPQAYLVGNKTYVKQKDLGNNNLNNYQTHNYSININQPVFRIVDWLDYHKTKKQGLAALKQYESIEQELIVRVANEYFAVLAATDQLAASRSATKAFARRLEQATKQFKVGVIAVTDVYEAQAKLDLAKATEIIDINNLNIAEENLSKIVGKKINKLAQVKNKILLMPPNPDNIELWVEKSRQHNLKLQSVRLEVEAAQEEIKSAYSNHLPTMNIVGTIADQKNPPPIQNKLYDKQIAINLQLPVFMGGVTNAKTKVAILQANAKLQQLELIHRETLSSTRVAYYTILSNISHINALEQAVKSNEIALKATQAAFKAGTRTMLDVLNAESNLLNARTDYAKAKYQYIVSSLQLKQATGSLCFNDLEQINKLLLEN